MLKVFLVEDEVVMREGIKNNINWEQEGFSFVGEASDGELAYPLIQKTRPDILITDIKMPFMDGLELSRLVKQELPDVKIIILSGYDDGTFRDDGLLTRAEASSVLVRLIDKNERINSDETLYDYFGRKVTWTEPLRTDVPEQYQVSMSDISISQAIYDEAVVNGGNISTKTLSRSKAMMFEDLVLQSIKYDGDTITLTVPDYLPESQRWAIEIAYWDIDKDYDFTMMKSYYIDKSGTYEFNDIKVLEQISIKVLPLNSNSFTSGIFIDNGANLSLERLDKPEVSFNNIRTNFEWVQGQGYKDYIKDFDGEIRYTVEW